MKILLPKIKVLFSVKFSNNGGFGLILSMSEQTVLFFLAVVLGFTAGFFYDIIRIFRMVVKHFGLLIQIEDFLYWVITAAVVFFVMLQKNFGEIRGFLVCGVFLGMLFYFLLLSKLFIKQAGWLINFLKKIVKFMLRLIKVPLAVLFKLLRNIFSPVELWLKKEYNKFRNLLKKNRLYVKIKGCKNYKGFSLKGSKNNDRYKDKNRKAGKKSSNKNK